MTHRGEINGQTDLKNCLEKNEKRRRQTLKGREIDLGGLSLTRSANTLKEIDLGQTRQSRQSRQTRLIRLNKINPAAERNSNRI